MASVRGIGAASAAKHGRRIVEEAFEEPGKMAHKSPKTHYQ
jgi:hypothetical protein